MRTCRSASLLLSVLGILISCEKPMSFLPDSVGVQVAQLLIVPASVTLLPSQSTQFIAFGRTSAGDSVGVAVKWNAQGGTVSPAGLYTATMPGLYQVCARATTAGASGCASVVVALVAPGQLSWPGVDTVEAFTTKRVMPDVGGEATTWTASAGTITPSGLYTAPSPGEYQVCAQAPGFLSCGRVLVTPALARYASEVLPRVASVTVNPPGTVRAAVGTTVQVTATVHDSRGTPLSGRP